MSRSLAELWRVRPWQTSRGGWRGGTASCYCGCMLSQELLEIIVCPACRQSLSYSPEQQTLTCSGCRRVYPIEDDIPILLVERASMPTS